MVKGNVRGPSDSSILRSDSSCDGQAEKLDCVSGGQKTLKVSLLSRGTTRHEYAVLMVDRQGDWTT